jgi:glyoxylase I family protein
MLIGIEHTALASPDPAKLAQWYVDNLGFWINYKYEGSPIHFVKAPNGSMFEIIPSEGERAPQTLKDPGIRHIAIAVDDFDGMYAALKAKGVNFLAEPLVKPGFKIVFFTDLDGNYLHLVQREQPLP